MAQRLNAAYYTPERDGQDIAEYIRRMKTSGANPLFYGSSQFQMLWKRGCLEPDISTIRLMRGIGADEQYGVVDDNTLEGINVPVHAGKPGRHSIVEILDQGINFEADNLNPRPIPR